MKRLRVGIIFGGESGEHEVSLASARSIIAALDPARHEPVLIGITRGGRWIGAESPEAFLAHESSRPLPAAAEEGAADGGTKLERRHGEAGAALDGSRVDVVFPVLHGPRGEDGTVQGLLELAGLPYVGSGVLASAVSMDKAMMKAVFAAAEIPGVPFTVLSARDWQRQRERSMCAVEQQLGYPVFVKPCNMGSSVGISKVLDRSTLGAAIDLACRYDRRVIVEGGVDAREVECAVLGNDDPLVSVPGEVVAHREFYDYDAKYTDGLADLLIPAHLDEATTREVRELARRAFLAVDAAGLARVDFFVRRDTGEVLVNEINTIPGFTATSMYPRLWEASGISYPELVDRLIQLALERHAAGLDHRHG